jgi:hypothetical protein
LAALSAGAAAIHFAVVFEHFNAYVLYGVFFLIIAWAQMIWAAVELWRPSSCGGRRGCGCGWASPETQSSLPYIWRRVPQACRSARTGAIPSRSALWTWPAESWNSR